MREKLLSEKLREANLIYREPVTLRSGEVAEYYADIKKAYGDPELLAEIATATLETMDDSTTCVAAAGYGGLPLGVAVSGLSGLPLSLVRDKKKNHGTQEIIDGYIPGPNDRVSILDDVFTTGSSLAKTAGTLQATGARILGCHVVVARGEVQDFELPVAYLFTPQDLTES